MIYVAPLLVFLLLAAPGVRLLWLASRTRQPPELWCGLYFMGAAVGMSLRVLGASLQFDTPDHAERLNTIGHVFFASGTIAMVVFTQRVFHPAETGARMFAGVVIAAIVGTTCHTIFGGYVAIENSYSIVATNAARIVPTAWAFLESLRYWHSMRKRLALGLSDPVVTNRFLLWSMWTGGVSLLPLIALGVRVLALVMISNGVLDDTQAADFQPNAMKAIRVAFLMIVPVAVAGLSLSFFPPRFYLDGIRRRAERRANAASA